MTSSDDSETGTAGRRIKVVRLIDEYGLDGVGGELERFWTAEGDERRSLRDLAGYFNRELLRTAMAEAGMQPLAGEVENIYRLLTDDDVSEADRTRTRRRLEREGVDVEQLQRDFVTYQAVRTYLKEYREAEYSPTERDPIEREVENLQRLRGKTTTVTEGKLEQLRSGGHVTLGDFRTLVDIRVLCEDCGTRYEVGDLLERGGCDCDADEAEAEDEGE